MKGLLQVALVLLLASKGAPACSGAEAAAPAEVSTSGGAQVVNAAQTNFLNSLGMRFVPVPGTRVHFCIWETRVQDYRAFCEGSDRRYQEADFAQEPNHPAVNVSWEDAEAFCRWLTGKERNEGMIKQNQRYRLPTDAEWNVAVALGTEASGFPEQKMKSTSIWPWGHYWPPLADDGNYGPGLKVDRFPATSPVGAFKPNRFGIYDLGGNVWEWCDDWYNDAHVTRTLRGASFNDVQPGYLASAYRFSGTMNLSNEDIGFRVVME